MRAFLCVAAVAALTPSLSPRCSRRRRHAATEATEGGDMPTPAPTATPAEATTSSTTTRPMTEAEAVEHFRKMQRAADDGAFFADGELASVTTALERLGLGPDRSAGLKEVLGRAAHLDYKRWHMTRATAASLANELPPVSDPEFATAFKRVLEGGNWGAASICAAARRSNNNDKPWVVLVTGLNGVRKTTAIYEPWFEAALKEAITAPDGSKGAPSLPTGANSFFRQLDFVVATVAMTQFEKLYAITDVAKYAEAKAAIFARYRTTSEMVGALLVEEASRIKANVLVETSGRDVGMFNYIDHFFDDAAYHKLALNFEIDDIAFAEASVDTRMLGEMERGRTAVASGDAGTVVEANQGGPYGSAVLKGVQAASRDTWRRIVANEAGGVGESWHRAAFRITPRADAPWTLAADVAGATAFEFTPR